MMRLETCQSILEFDNGLIKKTYKESHPFYNKKYLNNEIDILTRLKDNKYFVGYSEIHNLGYSMPEYDFSLGSSNKTNPKAIARILFSLSIREVLSNLDEILNSLKKLSIEHRDINPNNLIYSEKERIIKLNDFFWSQSNDNPIDLPEPNEEHPWQVNGIYGNNDKIAIDKIEREIICFYKNFIKSITEIINQFKSSVGHGDYKDGSSVYNGYAYHLVDIPIFKRTIKFHKNTCIKEYELIKKEMPIIPKSFLDIGAAEGYFTFNLLRYYNIKHCTIYEADPNVNLFLKNIAKTYSLHELEIRNAFNNINLPNRRFDIILFLNSHMWIHKQLGKMKTMECMSNLLKNCKYMFFQTCGSYSSGMYKVPEYKTPEDIEDMLTIVGAKDIKRIGRFIGSHDAPRDMFLVRGQL